MVDIMATTSDNFGKANDDFEDGELPEDGEIQDDEETTVPGASHHSPPAAGSPGVSAASPSHKKFAPRGFGDDTEVPAASNRDIWVPKENNGGDYGYGGEDRDYRFEDEGFGDSDYRQGGNRRRRHSPPGDDFDGGRRGRPWRPFKKPKWATEHQICKFFREGYCRDGDQCTYSHQAEDSLRKAELCRFYANGFCKKGLTCLALHGEFPCIAFHQGECTTEHCRFSHLPLTDYTRPLYEKRVNHDDMGMGHHGGHRGPPNYPPHGGPPGIPPRRRVLLPGGPGVQGGPQEGMSHHHPPAPTIHAPLPPSSNGQLPPPSVVVPTIANGPPHHQPPYPQMPPRGGFFPPAPMAQHSPPLRDDHLSQKPPAVAPQFDISQMLARIAGEAPVDDSPASPPMFGADPVVADHVRAIPDDVEVTWRLLPVEAPKPYHGVEPRATSNDPRMSRVIASQFDAVSNLFANDGAGLSNVSAPLADPRMRDPRRRPDERRPSDDKPRVSSWMPQIV